MKIIAFILNLPWTILGLLAVPVSMPKRVSFNKESFALVFHEANFWWYSWLPDKKFVRGMNFANVIILGTIARPGDLEHELIHLAQFERYPFIFAFMYEFETFRKGYRNNKYEEDAHGKGGNVYTERQK